MKHSIVIEGWGLATPWGSQVGEVLERALQNRPAPVEKVALPNSENQWPVRRTELTSLPLPRHPRLRRASSLTKFALSAACQALEGARISAGEVEGDRVGLILCVMNGCVNFTGRFYSEVVNDPATASPIFFPETVFNAPASHVAAVLGMAGPSYTLVGDSAQFLAGLELARDWIEWGWVERCLLIGAEELDALSAEAYRLFSPGMILSEGAGALVVGRGEGVSIAAHSEPFAYTHHRPPKDCHRQLASWTREAMDENGVLCESLWHDFGQESCSIIPKSIWPGERMVPAAVLGEGMGTSAAWQVVLGAELVSQKIAQNALVIGVGHNAQCQGVMLL